jgi:hypothetical protein
MKIKTFIIENNIGIDVEYADDNPNFIDTKTRMNHYKTVLKMGKKQMTVPFSMGIGLTHEPTAYDILTCLQLDVWSVTNNGSFEDFCSEFGYDTDSRKAEKTYNIILKQSEKLKKFLGEKFDQFMECEE